MAEGVPLRPVIWNRALKDFELASKRARAHLGQWSGPDPEGWERGDASPRDQWLLIVELVRGPHNPSAEQLQFAARRRGWRLAWVFHDAIPVRLAHLYGFDADAVAESHGVYMSGLSQSSLVVANSNTSAEHLRAFLLGKDLRADHVQALPLALEFPAVPRGSPPLLDWGLQFRPARLLSVGSLERRKNHVGLLKAVAWLKSTGSFPAQLLLVGWSNDPSVVDLVKRVQALGIPVDWDSDADDERLAAYYRWCDVTLVASMEEGFGLPVAESLWHGRPCLSTTGGGLWELLEAGGCLPLSGCDWRDLAKGIGLWLTQPQLRERLSREVSLRSLSTWSDYAQQMLERMDQQAESNVLQRLTPNS